MFDVMLKHVQGCPKLNAQSFAFGNAKKNMKIWMCDHERHYIGSILDTLFVKILEITLMTSQITFFLKIYSYFIKIIIF